MENSNPPILYILMRSDLASMNPGKAMAQASHAASMFHEIIKFRDDLEEMFDEWKNETGHFGTVLVLDVYNEEQMRQTRDIVDMMSDIRNAQTITQIVYDPTYPVRDGTVTWTLPVNTCAFVFCRHDFGKEFLGKLPLHA